MRRGWLSTDEELAMVLASSFVERSLRTTPNRQVAAVHVARRVERCDRYIAKRVSWRGSGEREQREQVLLRDALLTAWGH